MARDHAGAGLAPLLPPCTRRSRPWHDRLQCLLTGGRIEQRPMISNAFLKGRTAQRQARHHKVMKKLQAEPQKPVLPSSSFGPREPSYRTVTKETLPCGTSGQARPRQSQPGPEALPAKLTRIPRWLLPRNINRVSSQRSLGITNSCSQTSLTLSLDGPEPARPRPRPETEERLQDIAPADMQEGSHPPPATPGSARERPSSAARLENIPPPTSSEGSRRSSPRSAKHPQLQEEEEKEAEEQKKRERLQILEEHQSEWRQKHVAILQKRKNAVLATSRLRALAKEEEKASLQIQLDKQVAIEEEIKVQEEKKAIAGTFASDLGKRAPADPETSLLAFRRSSSKPLTRGASKNPPGMAREEEPKQHVDTNSNAESGINAAGSLTARRLERGKIGNFELSVFMSKKHALPLEVVRARLAEFKQFDADGNQQLTMSEFEQAIKLHCRIDKDQPLPEPIRAANLACADKNEDGDINFEEYLLWSMQTSFVEEMLVTDPAVREFRQRIRQYDLDPYDVDKTMALFSSFDTDGSGEIERDEFKALLCKLLNVRSETDIPAPELKRAWLEADPKNQGKIDFETFVVWYTQSGYLER